jgi:hypothetical protein
MTDKKRRIIAQLDDRASDYSSTEHLSIFAATWNVNGKQVSSNDIKEWLLPTQADIYVIGLQEVVELNMTTVVLSSSSSDKQASCWTVLLEKALNDGSGSHNEGFSLVIEKHMVGICCFVFVRQKLLANVSDVRFSKVCTGPFGLLGNKGGIVVRMKYIDSPMCFLFTHFHAKRSHIEARNADFRAIHRTTNFTPHQLPYPTKNPTRTNSSDLYREIYQDIQLTVDMHDHIIWVGDLNYRITEDLEVLEVFELVDAGEWKTLRDKDQLNLERCKGTVFKGFEEGVVNFPPTYKYKPNTTIYAGRPGDGGKKIRGPAWCDRILWKSRKKESCKLITYTSTEVVPSDHRPVSALFKCEIRVVQDEKLQRAYQEVLASVEEYYKQNKTVMCGAFGCSLQTPFGSSYAPFPDL